MMLRLFTVVFLLAVSVLPCRAQSEQAVEPVDQANRQREIQVELAWHGDTQACRLPLTARMVGGELHVWGAVPDRKAGDRAIELAHKSIGIQVVDHLQVDRTLASVTKSRPAYLVQRDAAQIVAMAHPSLASRVQLQAWTLGQIMVRGQVPSLEDKLAISRTLRQVAGCCCVVNRLQVTGAPAVASVKRAETAKPVEGILLVGAGVEAIAPPQPLTDDALRQRIARACGCSEAKIHISRQASELQIELRAATVQEGEQMSQRTFALPELKQLAISLMIVID